MIMIQLKKLMKNANLNQAALQRRTGIRGGTLSDLIHNRSKMIPTDVLEALCGALDIQPADLLVYIPRQKEFDYWQHYAQSFYLHKHDDMLTEEYTDFCGIIDGLTGRDEAYVTGRRKQDLTLEEVLDEHHLVWDEDEQKIVSADQYYVKPDVWSSADVDYTLLREKLSPFIIGFWDSIATETEKTTGLRRLWHEHDDWKINEMDRDHKVPQVMRRFLLIIENGRRRRRKYRLNE